MIRCDPARRAPRGAGSPAAGARPRRAGLAATLPLVAAFAALAPPCVSAQTSVQADLVLRGGAIYTMDAARSWASALAIGNGRILYVGDERGVVAWVGERTRVLDLDGRMVLPGFHDSHVHPVSGGVELLQCDLNGLGSREAVLAAVRACAARDTAGWIVGGGWDLPLFPGANPRKELLDSIAPARPVYLSAADGHSAWVSSRALALAGIDRSTPDPPDGRIERDARTGEPTGTLRESAASLVARLLPETTPAEYREGLRRALAMANRFGITSLIEASAGERALETYLEADRAGELTVRVLASQRVDPGTGAAQVTALAERRARYRGRRLRADAAKLFADGVIESHTAALLEPYLDTPAERGALALPRERLDSLVAALDAADFQVHIHAIGDRAIRASLDALAQAARANGPRDRRHHVAHIQLFDPADLPRFRALGVTANFQPLWAFADPYITELTEPVLGPERSRWLYPIGSVIASGAVVVGGSDWSVSSMNPLDAIEVAVRRQAPGDTTGAPWIPAERATLHDMLAAYTINGAWLARQEDVTGSLEVGKAADLIVLDRNLFEIPAHAIHAARVRLTLLEGAAVYAAPEYAALLEER